MPANCCVPKCTKKGCQDENGSKVSYYKFPNNPISKRKWIHAIRRDEGKDFTITEWTKVCNSRHFRDYDFHITLNGRRKLNLNAI